MLFRSLVELQRFYYSHFKQFSELQRVALQRRIHFLTIDFFVQMRRNGCSFKEFRMRILQLKKQQLIPLPAANYSHKYILARTVINLIIV